MIGHPSALLKQFVLKFYCTKNEISIQLNNSMNFSCLRLIINENINSVQVILIQALVYYQNTLNIQLNQNQVTYRKYKRFQKQSARQNKTLSIFILYNLLIFPQMQIITRDIFRTYFPKYNAIYQSLWSNNPTQDLPQISLKAIKEPTHHNGKSLNKNDGQHQDQQLHGDYQQLKLIPDRRSTSSTKSKKNHSFIRLKSKQKPESQRIDNELQLPINHNDRDSNHKSNSHTQYPMTIQEKERLNQLLNQRLIKQIENYVQNHRFFSSNQKLFTVQQCISHLKFLLSKCIHLSTQNHPSNMLSSHSKSHSSRNSKLLATLAPLSHPPVSLAQPLHQLSLYLNKQTNKQIFSVYEHILLYANSGISYETLSKKLKTDIINVSHYCCKLKKMRFVDWQHRREGVVVFPIRQIEQEIKQKTGKNVGKNLEKRRTSEMPQLEVNRKYGEKVFDYEKSFIYHELTLNQNILVNVASANSLLQGGMTNQEIKYKIMKHAQNKMVRRTVEGMKNITKNAQRQGKVFQFKYKKQTQLMSRQLDKKRVQNSGVINLTQKCRQYINSTFASSFQQKIQLPSQIASSNPPVSSIDPTNMISSNKADLISPPPLPLSNQPLLLSIINTKLTDYISSIGIKQSKRQCTPLKLNRYIHILNYLQKQGPDTEYELRRHIIQVEKQMENSQQNGVIHKRSMIGILEGLKKVGLIEEVDECYYPKWVQGEKKREGGRNAAGGKMQRRQLEDQLEDLRMTGFNNLRGNKKIKMDNPSEHKLKNNQKKSQKFTIPQDKIRMITKRQHLSQIFAELLNITFQKAMKKIIRKGFHRIMYVQRKRQSIPIFIPQRNLFHLLDDPYAFDSEKVIKQHATTLESFMSQIDMFVQNQGNKLFNFPQVQYQVVKFTRRNPIKNSDSLRSKYGKSWQEKFQPLEKEGVLKLSNSGYETIHSFNGFLV